MIENNNLVKRKVGRPSLNDNKKPSHNICFRLDFDTYWRLKRFSDLSGINVSTILQTALNDYLIKNAVNEKKR